MTNKTTNKQNESTLYNLSAYARAYTPAAGQPADGFILSGYASDKKNGGKSYVNIWVRGENVIAKRRQPDGTIALSIKFAEVEIIDRSKRQQETAAAAGNLPAPSNKGKKKPDLQSFDDNFDVPF